MPVSRLQEAIDKGDVATVEAVAAEHPGLLSQDLTWRADHIAPCTPLTYLAQARFNGYVTHDRSGEMARVLLAAGAPVNGRPEERETPLITAASYDEPRVARALIDGGAELEAQGHAVPLGTALAHAVHFGAPEIADMLVQAGARISSLTEAAGAGDLTGWTIPDPLEVGPAFRAAAVCARTGVLERFLESGFPVNQVYDGGAGLHWAAWEAKVDAARFLVSRGANPLLRDPQHNSTALGWARYRAGKRPFSHPSGFAQVIEYLESITPAEA